MLRILLVVALTASVARAEWRAAGAGGTCVVVQSDGPSCGLEARDVTTRQVLWRGRGCVAQEGFLGFAEDACEHLLVLNPSPALRKSGQEATVAALYRRGAPVRSYALREFGALLKKGTKRARWIAWAGVDAGAAGVTVRSSGGASVELPWSGEAPVRLSRPAATTDAPKAPCGQGIACSWEDDEGTFHVADSLERVPLAFRGRVKGLDGSTVSVMPAPPPRPHRELERERDEAVSRARRLEAELRQARESERRALEESEARRREAERVAEETAFVQPGIWPVAADWPVPLANGQRSGVAGPVPGAGQRPPRVRSSPPPRTRGVAVVPVLPAAARGVP